MIGKSLHLSMPLRSHAFGGATVAGAGGRSGGGPHMLCHSVPPSGAWGIGGYFALESTHVCFTTHPSSPSPADQIISTGGGSGPVLQSAMRGRFRSDRTGQLNGCRASHGSAVRTNLKGLAVAVLPHKYLASLCRRMGKGVRSLKYRWPMGRLLRCRCRRGRSPRTRGRPMADACLSRM
jgi:hypothetical protein